MVREKFSMQTELVASEDGLHTYEVQRSWSDKGRKGIVLELYPTLSAGRCGELDLSTMHLLNHVKDFGWGAVRIINLYSIVCCGKPKTGQLHYEQENLAYIEEVLESSDIAGYDIVVATGNSLGKHRLTNEIKMDIFHMLRDKKLEKQVKCIVTDSMGEKKTGIHPLFLGLHYSKDIWKLESYPLQKELEALEGAVNQKPDSIDSPEKNAEAEPDAVEAGSADAGKENNKNISTAKKKGGKK